MQVFSCNGVKLTDKIFTMMYEFEGRTGQKPKAIYLGYKTRTDLLNEVGSKLLFPLPIIEIQRPTFSKASACSEAPACGETPTFSGVDTFSGVPIFIVDEEEHLNVG